MRIWLLNPRMAEIGPPNPSIPRSVVCLIDCPCGCGRPWVLPTRPGIAFPALGETLSQAQWQARLNSYNSGGRLHRIIEVEGQQCVWGGRILLGRTVYGRRNAGDAADDQRDERPFAERRDELKAWLVEVGDIAQEVRGVR